MEPMVQRLSDHMADVLLEEAVRLHHHPQVQLPVGQLIPIWHRIRRQRAGAAMFLRMTQSDFHLT